jgi:hypothetical protein
MTVMSQRIQALLGEADEIERIGIFHSTGMSWMLEVDNFLKVQLANEPKYYETFHQRVNPSSLMSVEKGEIQLLDIFRTAKKVLQSILEDIDHKENILRGQWNNPKACMVESDMTSMSSKKPNIIYNYNYIQTSKDISIQQGSDHAIQNVTTNHQHQMNGQLREIIDGLRGVQIQSTLPAEKKEELSTKIQTLESQSNSPEPLTQKIEKIKKTLSSIKDLLINASEVVIVAGTLIAKIDSWLHLAL